VLSRLLPLLPEGQRTDKDLRDQLRSPQLQQTVARLSSILNSHQFNAVMASLSLNNKDGGIGVKAFIQAIQNQVKQEEQDKKKKDEAKDKDKDKDNSKKV